MSTCERYRITGVLVAEKSLQQMHFEFVTAVAIDADLPPQLLGINCGRFLQLPRRCGCDCERSST